MDGTAVALPYALVDGVLLHHAAVAAHELGLFRCLADGPLSPGELAARLDLDEHAVDLLTGAAASFGVVARRDGHVGLTAMGHAAVFAEDGRPSTLLSHGAHLLRERYGYDRLLDCLRRNGDLASGGRPAFDTDWFGPDPDHFAEAMHEHALPHAASWPGLFDLAEHDVLLDVGGGSGTHSIAAVKAAPHLKAVILELPAIGGCAWRAIAEQGFSGRIQVVAGDMWTSRWPEADLHLLSDVLHDWAPKDAARLVRRSFDALPPGGRLVVLEMPLGEDGSGPPEVVASSLAMLLLTGGRQYSVLQLEDFLSDAGFVEVSTLPVLGPWHATLGSKPSDRTTSSRQPR